MLPRHVSQERTPQARGLAFGTEHRAGVRATLSAYRALFFEYHGLTHERIRALGSQVGDQLSSEHPALLEEVSGMAEGARVDCESLLAVNARTEIMAGVARPECSTIAVLPSRSLTGTILAQNWDWHPELTDSRVLWTVVESDGRWFTTMTEAGILGKIGVNSTSLGVCLNMLGSSADGGVGGIPIHVLLRLVLQHADSIESAEALLRDASVTASSCLTIGCANDQGANIRAFEISPRGVVAVHPRRGLILHTNHFLSSPDGLKDVFKEKWPDTLVRLDDLKRRLGGEREPIDESMVKRALASHEGGPIAVCCHDGANPRFGDRQATLASLFMTLENPAIEITDGAPCASPYQRVYEPAGLTS